MFPDSDREEAAGGSKVGGLVVAPKQMSSGLASVLASYGSASESESDGEPEGLFPHEGKTIPIHFSSVQFISLHFATTYIQQDQEKKKYCSSSAAVIRNIAHTRVASGIKNNHFICSLLP